MQRLQKYETGFDGHIAVIRQPGPSILIVGFDGGLVLGQRPLEPNEAIHVAVGDVMDHLPYGPPAGPIGRVELLFREPVYSRANQPRQRGNLIDPTGQVLTGDLTFVFVFADGIAESVHVRMVLRSGGG